MLARKFAWTLWALLPVGALAYHFGPGQVAYTEDRAQSLLTSARTLEADAETAQAAAYESHLAALQARRALAATESPSAELTAAAKAAAAREDEAYKAASVAWKATADRLQQAQDLLASCDSPKTPEIRVAKSRALIRSGSIVEGVGELETMLDTLAETDQQESPLAREVREELATGYYYGARLMRIAGKPAAEWREVSGYARQNFRYLAESESDVKADALQKNLELVLNLEQSGQEDLLAKPLPKNSPRSNCEGLGNVKKKGVSKRPPRKGPDARGASGVGDVPAGW